MKFKTHPRDYSHITDERTRGQRWADSVSRNSGSWGFILLYVATTLAWVIYNVKLHGPDPYPFILYTMLVSVLAILMSSIILLAGNRQAEVDRAHAEMSYKHTDEILLIQHEQLLILQKLLEEQEKWEKQQQDRTKK